MNSDNVNTKSEKIRKRRGKPLGPRVPIHPSNIEFCALVAGRGNSEISRDLGISDDSVRLYCNKTKVPATVLDLARSRYLTKGAAPTQEAAPDPNSPIPVAISFELHSRFSRLVRILAERHEAHSCDPRICHEWLELLKELEQSVEALDKHVPHPA